MSRAYYLFRTGRDVYAYLNAPAWMNRIVDALILQEMEDERDGGC